MDNEQQNTDSNSLETNSTTTEQASVVSTPSAIEAPVASPNPLASPDSPTVPISAPKNSGFKKFKDKINIYFVLLIVVLLCLGGIVFYAIQRNSKASNDAAPNTKTLTQDALDKISGSDATIGDPKQTLSVESNAIFAGALLVKGNLDVAGTIKIGGVLSLPGLNVGGTTSVEQLASKSLTVAGDTAIQGKVVVQNGLSVTGATSFSGSVTAPQITVNDLQLNNDLKLSRHITTNGGTPSRTNGTSLGSGGTATLNGNDIAGTITINTGNSAPVGCFLTATFTTAYAAIPRVIISAASSSAAGISYYTNRTTTGFSVCTVTDPPDNTSNIIFDYVVIG